MNVLLLGSTGLLGHNVLHCLLKEGHKVVALVRNAEVIKDVADNPLLTVVKGSLTNVEDLRRAIQGCDAVVNCAGTTDMSLLRYDDYLPVNKTLCEQVLQLMDEMGIATYVHVSTANTVGYGTSNSPGTEEAEMRSPFAESYYARSKREAETMIDWYSSGHPQGHIVILNPGFMVGAYDSKPSSGKLLLAAYRRSVMAVPTGGKSFVHVSDVAQATVNALTMGRNGERYLITGHDMSLREFYTRQAAVCGYRQKIVTVPDLLLRLAGFAGDLLRWMGIKTQLSSLNVRQLMVMEYYSNEKARQELALPVTPIDKAIADFFEWRNE